MDQILASLPAVFEQYHAQWVQAHQHLFVAVPPQQPQPPFNMAGGSAYAPNPGAYPPNMGGAFPPNAGGGAYPPNAGGAYGNAGGSYNGWR